MSSYNTTTISNIFARLYTNLRRYYTQYAANFLNRQFLVFANVVLKRSDRIPYYGTVDAAFSKNNPIGYLPTDISPYYFKERPVFFYDQLAFMQWRIGNNNSYSLTANPPYIILNLFLEGQYRDVYVNYDSSKMNLELLALDAILFVDQQQPIIDLQKKLEDVIVQLVYCYNRIKMLEGAQTGKKYNNQAYIDKAKKNVDGWINSLQQDVRFVVKVCRECQGNAYLGDIVLPNITFIAMAGAVALTWMVKSYAQYDQVAYYLDELQIVVDRQAIELDMQYKIVQGAPAPVDSGVKPMEEATVVAKVKKNWWWLVLVGVGLVAVSSSGKNKSEKK